MSTDRFHHASRYSFLSISKVFLYVGIIILVVPQLLVMISFLADLLLGQAPVEGEEKFKAAYNLRILAGSVILSFVFFILSFLFSKVHK